MEMKVSDYIVKRLADEGVKTVFGYQGGNISHLIDSIGNSESVQFVETYHEQAAAFAANAYAQMTNTIGVALASSGPGAINLLNGVANAYCDSIPCLFFTGDVNITAKKPYSHSRQDAFQEIDIVSMAKPVTKYCVTMDSVETVLQVLEKAITAAKTGRPGPVLINLPHDIQRSMVTVEPAENVADMPAQESAAEACNAFDRALSILENAQRPVLIIGGGMRSVQAKRYLQAVLEKCPFPVVSSLLGLDVLSHDHNSFCGMIGDYGNRSANLALKYADCIVALGTRLDDRQIGRNDSQYFADKKVIHIDVDRHELNSKLSETVSVATKAEHFLAQMLECPLERMRGKVISWLKVVRAGITKCDSAQNTEERFLRKLSKNTDAQQVVYTFDVGNNQMCAAQQVYIKKGGHVLTSGGLGSMGYSLPAAIGASFANPDAVVNCITGDGGLQMNLQELNTVDVFSLPINIILMNNCKLGMIFDLQQKMFPGHYYGTIDGYHAPDFEKIAEAYHFTYLCVENEQEYEAALTAMQNTKRVFVDVKVPFDNTPCPTPGRGIFNQNPELLRENLEELEAIYHAEN